MPINVAIEKEFIKARGRGWKRIYVFVDLHECILKPTWSDTSIHEYYPETKELLQELSAREDVILIMWTCSHPDEIENYIQNFESDGIHFDYVNENPEIKTDNSGDGNSEKPKYGCYDKKPYYNILLDDKAGILPEDIPIIREEFKRHSLI